ncbi:hypothetical protein K3495_g5170 [Podosphaera aphanis]|nr:hypothetical protein K3495_g5170 [Podosphaera aphanis]
MWTPTIVLTLALLVNIITTTKPQQPQPEDSVSHGVLCAGQHFTRSRIREASFDGCEKYRMSLEGGLKGIFARKRPHPIPFNPAEFWMTISQPGPYAIWHITPDKNRKLKNKFYVLFRYDPKSRGNCEPINVLIKRYSIYVKCTSLSSSPNPSLASSPMHAQPRPGTNHGASSSSGSGSSWSSGSGSGSGSRPGHSRPRYPPYSSLNPAPYDSRPENDPRSNLRSQRNSPHMPQPPPSSSPPKTPYPHVYPASISKHSSDSSDNIPALEKKIPDRPTKFTSGAFGSFIDTAPPKLPLEKSL